MAKVDIERIAKRLGGEVKGKVSARSGYFGALALEAEVERRFRKPPGGGRATDPEWTTQRLVRCKPRTLDRLKHLADQMSRDGHRVEPMQMAALLLEKATEQITDQEIERLSESESLKSKG